jgi:hypothetical protein
MRMERKTRAQLQHLPRGASCYTAPMFCFSVSSKRLADGSSAISDTLRDRLVAIREELKLEVISVSGPAARRTAHQHMPADWRYHRSNARSLFRNSVCAPEWIGEQQHLPPCRF